MEDKRCCVCSLGNAHIPLSSSDSSEDTIKNKLQTIVSEVHWEDTFCICSQCFKTLDIAIEFRKTCLRSNSIRMEMGKSISSTECNIDENEEIESVKVASLLVHKNNKEETSEKDDNYCNKCNFKFSCQSEYEDHVKKHIFICFHCNKSYKSKVILAKHIKLKHQSHKKPIAEESDSNSENVDADSTHFSSYSENEEVNKLFKCSKCEKTYKTEKVMLNHTVACDGVKRHSKINYLKDFSKNECEKCGNFYTTQKILKAHSKQCKGKSSFSLENKCAMCDSILKNYEEKFQHVLDMHNINLKTEKTCQYCYKQFVNNESLEIHVKEEHENSVKKHFVDRSYKCEVCSKVFGYVKEVVQHCVKEHQMEAKSVRPYLCDKCQRRFTSSANLIQHKQYHNGERTHICSFCGKSFITTSDLTVHEYTHLNRRNYKCEFCEKAFNTNKNLRSHKLVVHTDSSEWKYQCDLCDKRFPLKSGYDQHARRHTGDKRFKCSLCEKLFISSSELTKHMMFHSIKRAFKCDHCEKDYKDRRVYEIHLKKVHGIGNAKIPVRVKKFACYICPGTFVDKQKLSRHMCTHTGIKPYVCSVCKKGFSDKSYLKHHLKTVHKIVDAQSSDANYLQIV